MKILILRDCEAECILAKKWGDDYINEREKEYLYKDEEYEVSDYITNAITESGLNSLEEGVDWVSQKSYEAGRAYQRLVEMAMYEGKTVEEYVKSQS